MLAGRVVFTVLAVKPLITLIMRLRRGSGSDVGLRGLSFFLVPARAIEEVLERGGGIGFRNDDRSFRFDRGIRRIGGIGLGKGDDPAQGQALIGLHQHGLPCAQHVQPGRKVTHRAVIAEFNT